MKKIFFSSLASQKKKSFHELSVFPFQMMRSHPTDMVEKMLESNLGHQLVSPRCVNQNIIRRMCSLLHVNKIITINGSVIYTALYIMILMQANPLRGQL